jgi:S1-C subfamily serine protease
MEQRMNRIFAGMLVATLGCALTGVSSAQDKPSGQTGPEQRLEQAEAEKALAEAQRQLEEAARKVAELSMQVHDWGGQELRRIHVGGPGRAMLGINIGSAGPGTDGVRVVSVSPGGPAAEAGVLAGDLVVAMDGRRVASGRDLVGYMHDARPGQKVALELLRDGKQANLLVIARPLEDVMIGGDGGRVGHSFRGMPPLPHFLVGPWGDAELVEMTPGLGRYFGTDTGLLVVRAPKAAGADIEDGDVILAIGGREPRDAGHALRILGSYQPGETVDLRLLRQKKERSVRITIPQRPAMRDFEFEFDPPPGPPAPPAPPAPPGAG